MPASKLKCNPACTLPICVQAYDNAGAVQIPAWPFVSLSFAFGVFALGPYFALWKPSKEAKAPPAQQELQGWRNVGLKGTESKVAGWLLLGANLILLGQVRGESCQ